MAVLTLFKLTKLAVPGTTVHSKLSLKKSGVKIPEKS